MQFWVDKVIPLTLHFASRGPRPSITRTPPTLAFALPLPPIPNIAHSYWHFNKQWLVDLITWAELYLSYSTYPTRLLTQAPGRKHAPFRSRPPLPSSPLSLSHTHTHTHTHTFPPRFSISGTYATPVATGCPGAAEAPKGVAADWGAQACLARERD